jgi:hypothetical protein
MQVRHRPLQLAFSSDWTMQQPQQKRRQMQKTMQPLIAAASPLPPLHLHRALSCVGALHDSSLHRIS